MLSDLEKNLVLQIFYTPMNSKFEHETVHVVHNVKSGKIHRVYTENYVCKHSEQAAELDALPKAESFTITSFSCAELLKEAEDNRILNKPLVF